MGARQENPVGLKFGRFLLLPHRRELLAGGQPVNLGGRAFDVLMALTDARGAVLSKDALMERVWSGQIIEQNALQSQIWALRSALGADRGLIRTVSGRGYQFTGDILVVPSSEDGDAAVPMAGPGELRAHDQVPTNLPEPISELIGREDVLSEILNLAAANRLVTLTGSGGIGKTRLALAAARELMSHFADGVWLVELSPVADPVLVPATVAAAIGVEIGPGEVSAQRVAVALSDRRLLVVLDTCEHVIAAAARVAEALLHAGRAVQVLATSREPLQAEGEWIYPVPPLPVPSEDVATQDELLRYGAVQLFVQRALAANPRFAPDPRDVTKIAAICRRIDGIPLAIEMAAARSSTLRTDEIAARLDDRFQLLIGRRRTAILRHLTLRATLDWSYELLPELERVILLRLGIFAGPFTLDAVSAVAASPPEVEPWQVIEGVSILVAKSLVVGELDGTSSRFRLLDTMRAYALEKLDESGERARLARLHAEYYLSLFERAEAEWGARPPAEWLADYGRAIDNLRTALDWAESPSGDPWIGIALTAATVPLWMQLSLLEECRSRVEQALGSLTSEADPRLEMKLRAALGAALMYTTSATDPETGGAWTRALEIAERLGDTEYQLRALLGVWSWHMRSGQHRVALELAQRFRSLAMERPDTNDRLIGERLIGDAKYLGGNLLGGRRHIEHLLAHYTVANRWPYIHRFQIDHLSAARAFLARILWLQGFPDTAMHTAETSIAEAQETEHIMSMCYVLALSACPIALFAGDLGAAEDYIAMLLDCSRRHAITLWQDWGRYYQGVLLVKRGDLAAGMHALRTAFNVLGAAKFAVRFVTFLGDAALALGKTGQIAAGLAEVDEALRRFGHGKESWLITDLLRTKGELLLLQAQPSAAASAAGLFREALDRARRHRALSWELRAATSLARLLRDQGQSDDALELLRPVYNRFTEGLDTADLKAAQALLPPREHGDAK